MADKRTKAVYVFKRTTIMGICIGFATFLFSIFENDINNNYVLSFFGLGIMMASMITFGFGMCLHLMDETAEKSKGNNTSSKNNLYYFLEKRTYY